MNRPGRLLRQIMKDHDSAERIAERIRHREICNQAVREREERYPNLTAENVAEAMAFQERRIQELTKRSPTENSKLA